MKNMMKPALTLLALALVAQGKALGSAIEDAAKAFVASNSVENVLADGAKARRLKEGIGVGAIVGQIVSASETEVGPACVWLLARGTELGVSGAESKLESLTAGNADATVKENAARAFVSSSKNKAKAKAKIAQLPITDSAARAIARYATVHADKKAAEDWFDAAKGKGLSCGPYRKRFLDGLITEAPNEQLLEIQQEIAGLMKGARDMDAAKPWVEELRYRLYVAKEAAGQ
ncbi:MAG: hypothetical protein IT577_13355 [Verrucomicrobiae bacterium]|nr:hypothetical protein [Verrucomicrobiae bacterium]